MRKNLFQHVADMLALPLTFSQPAVKLSTGKMDLTLWVRGKSACSSYVSSLLLLSALWKALPRLIVDSYILIVIYLYVIWQFLTILYFLWLIKKKKTSCQKNLH